MRYCLLLFIWITLFSCRKNISYHPNEVLPSHENLNAKNISLINKLAPRDSFRFVFTGDTQLAYDDTDDFIKHINSMADVSFVVFNGDYAEYGLNSEFNLFAEKLDKLKLPFVAVIGNHDMLANGRTIYRTMFGVENFSFNYGNSFFVLMNTNSGEAGFDGTLPDINWIKKTIDGAGSYTNVFFISHVPPYSSDFDRKLEDDYHKLISSPVNSRLSLHGHLHNYTYAIPYNDGFPYLVAPAISKREYILVSVMNDTFKVEVKSF